MTPTLILSSFGPKTWVQLYRVSVCPRILKKKTWAWKSIWEGRFGTSPRWNRLLVHLTWKKSKLLWIKIRDLEACRRTLKTTPPLEYISSSRFFPNTRRARTTKLEALEITRRDVSIHASLDVLHSLSPTTENASLKIEKNRKLFEGERYLAWYPLCPEILAPSVYE